MTCSMPAATAGAVAWRFRGAESRTPGGRRGGILHIICGKLCARITIQSRFSRQSSTEKQIGENFVCLNNFLNYNMLRQNNSENTPSFGRTRLRHIAVMRNVHKPGRARAVPDQGVSPKYSETHEVVCRSKRRQPARCARSASITGPVRGSRPRQSRNDSAACSTSIPRPSVAMAAPCPAPQSTNGVGRAA